jgi:hypothetical protein
VPFCAVQIARLLHKTLISLCKFALHRLTTFGQSNFRRRNLMSEKAPTLSQSFAHGVNASGPAFVEGVRKGGVAFVQGLIAAFLTIGATAPVAPQRTLSK